MESELIPPKKIKLDHSYKIDPNDISRLCYEQYNKLGKSGKPNENTEHTVLAAVVEQERSSTKLRVVALATGTKCFPQNVERKHEDIVDCHAESLMKRAFKRYLIGRLDYILDNNISLEQFQNEVTGNHNYYIFVSQTPCGCITRWQGESESQSNQTELNESNLKSFKLIGVNRKPGRGDLCPKAGCIHKLAKWNAFGIQGKRLCTLTNKAIVPYKIIIGNCETNQNEFLQQEICDRITIDQTELRSIEGQLLHSNCFNFDQINRKTIVEFSDQFRHKVFIRETDKSSCKKPSGSCIVAWLQDDTLHSEVIAGGRKLGTTNRRRRERNQVEKTTMEHDDRQPDDVIVALNDCSVVVVDGQCARSKDETRKHRPGDLAICDTSLNRRVDQLIGRFVQKW
ncbi:tRNA-specific adenosine deaminase 1 [Blomia tropicalis]|nr:tRNA-specific adenosine deaminase 1 [Blomia tropicalis]